MNSWIEFQKKTGCNTCIEYQYLRALEALKKHYYRIDYDYITDLVEFWNTLTCESAQEVVLHYHKAKAWAILARRTHDTNEALKIGPLH